MEPLTKSKNPLRDYRKAVVAVMVKYFAVDASSIRFSVKALCSHRALGDSPAYVALSSGRTLGLRLAPACQTKQGL